VQTIRQLGPESALKITTARYFTPSGRSIQAKGIVPDVALDETAEGNVVAALRTREADLEKHLANGPEEEEAHCSRHELVGKEGRRGRHHARDHDRRNERLDERLDQRSLLQSRHRASGPR
jgi:C-terminal processing protease CtpA/Prc